MKRSQKLVFALLVCGSLMIAPQTDARKKNRKVDYVPPEFEIEIETEGVPGGKANLSVRLQAPPDQIWATILDANNHADTYPRLKRSFCISEENVIDAKKKGLRNGATVERRYKKEMCNPQDMSQPGKEWDYHLFQEIDYPFPLTDRWMLTKVVNDETESKKGIYKQKGELIYGRQDVYEFALEAHPHPKYPDQTYFTMFIWSDPGGFIADWMIKEATKYIAPRFMEILDRESQKRAGLPLSSPEEE
jgi:hypothetical protein